MRIAIVVLWVLLLGVSGCLYSNVKAPLDTDVSNTQLGNKVGVSSTHSVLYLLAWGDGGTAAAAKNGGLSVVKHLDIQYESYAFGVYSKVTTIAYGD